VRGFTDLVDVENSLLYDAHLRALRCLLANAVMSNEWKHNAIFYTLVRYAGTLMKMVIEGVSTINVIAESAIKQ